MDYTIEFTKSIKVTDENIDDIMAAALEGGITYWCCEAEVVGDYLGEYASDQISRGGTLILYDSEDDEKYELNKEKLLNGIMLAAKNNYYSDYEWINGNEIDTCNVDADVADCIVQFALFNEVVYG